MLRITPCLLELASALVIPAFLHAQDSLTRSTPSTCQLNVVPIDTVHGYRLRDGFLYGEKATSASESQQKDVPEPVLCTVRQLLPGSRINALGHLEILLQNSEALIQHLRGRGYNVILVPEIRRAGEVNWLRIEVPNRYYRQVQAVEIDPNAISQRLRRMAGLQTEDISEDSLLKLVSERTRNTGG